MHVRATVRVIFSWQWNVSKLLIFLTSLDPIKIPLKKAFLDNNDACLSLKKLLLSLLFYICIILWDAILKYHVRLFRMCVYLSLWLLFLFRICGAWEYLTFNTDFDKSFFIQLYWDKQWPKTWIIITQFYSDKSLLKSNCSY